MLVCEHLIEMLGVNTDLEDVDRKANLIRLISLLLKRAPWILFCALSVTKEHQDRSCTWLQTY